ncbi:MAG TPA: hypothetical protein VEL07_10675 [Planctomycetota bacterium]|nr:hypothetical protein [Planctomycetota bacterium]
MRIVLLMVLATSAMAVDATAADTTAADRAYGEGLAAYERGLAAHALKDTETATSELTAARAALDDAISRYRALISTSGTVLPDAERRLGDALAVGRACCGRESLWKRYAVGPKPTGK